MVSLKGSADDTGGIAGYLTELAEGMGRLITQHLQLARIELTQEGVALGRKLTRLALFVPFVLVGYGLFCAALALVLGRVMPLDAAFGLVAAANLLGGGMGLARAARGLRAPPQVLDESFRELKSSAATLSAVTHTTETPDGR